MPSTDPYVFLEEAVLADLEDMNDQDDFDTIRTSLEVAGTIPDMDTNPENLEVSYSTRGPRDVVVSGPVKHGWGPGRFFTSRRGAFIHCVNAYGKDRVRYVPNVRGRWAFLIKELKQ